MTRTTVLIVLLVIIGGGVAAAVLVSSSGSGGDSSAVSIPASTPTASTTAPVTTGATVTSGQTTGAAQSASRQVEATVTSYVQAAEEGDATTLCALQLTAGAGGSGSGESAAQACASQAGITLTDLPALTGLKIVAVKVSGDSATAQLGRVGLLSLRRSNGRWKITGFAPKRSKRNGGSEAPSGPNVGGVAAG